jgi:superfamily II DNA or RNA helicase
MATRRLLKLAVQAYALGIAYEFDPYFGLSISRVDPLPHQLEAVYDYLLKVPRVRFLLADDAGAGKTVMAGLLLRELKLRGLCDRILVVCPANLTFQWQRELKDKFDEKFEVLRGSDIREQYGVNQWLERPQVITSLDLAPRTPDRSRHGSSIRRLARFRISGWPRARSRWVSAG